MSKLEQRVMHGKVRGAWMNTWKHDAASWVLTSAVLFSILVLETAAMKFTEGVRLVALPFVWISIGVAQHSLGVLGHESYHDSFFRKPSLNLLIGKWVFHYPLLGRFQLLKKLHFEHHRYVGSEKDPDQDHWNWRSGELAHIKHILKIISGAQFLSNIWKAGSAVAFSASGRGVELETALKKDSKNRDYLGILVTQSIIILTFFFFGALQNYFMFWLLPLITVSPAIEDLRVYCEHRDGKLRIFSAPSPPENLIFGRANFSLHALHHLSPSTPWFAIGSKYDQVLARSREITISKNYVSELKNIWRNHEK